MITIPRQLHIEPISITGSFPGCGITFKVTVEAHGHYIFDCPGDSCTHRIHVEA